MIGKAFRLSRQVAASYKNLFLRGMLHPLPIQMFQVEVTKRCNGHCVYCNSWKHNGEQTILLTPQDIRKYLSSKLLLNVKEIALTGGEPMLRKDLVEFVAALKEVSPKASFGLVTNGLKPETAVQTMKELKSIDSNVHVGVSIDGFEQVDGIQRGNKKHYGSALKTAKLLQQEGFDVGIGSVVTPLNLQEQASFHEFCLAQGFHHSIMTANPSSHFYGDNTQQTDKYALSETDIDTFEKIIPEKTSFQYYFNKYMREQCQVNPCFSGFNTFFMDSTGNVFPCIALNKPYGNIKETPFNKLWTSTQATEVREHIFLERCHCYTLCEQSGDYMANILPAVKKRLAEKIRK